MIPILLILGIVFLLTQTSEHGVEFTRRTFAALFFTAVALLSFGATRAQAAGTLYYIDILSGSNSNSGTSEGSPWRSAPGMQQGAGCAGATHSYSHVSGDKFLFKGGAGETWPGACFEINLSVGGTSAAQDYWGVCLSTDSDSPCFGGTSWPSTGWTQPKWGGSNGYLGSGDNFFHLAGAGDFTAPSEGYITLDNIEIGNWNVAPQNFSNGNTDQGPAIVMGCALNYCYGVGTIAENLYIHDWVADTSATPGSTAFGYGMVYGAGLLQNSTISDQSGYYKVNGTLINWPFMGGCAGCIEVKNDKFAYLWMGCSSVLSCHDSEFDHMEEDTSGLTYNNPPAGLGIHSHAIYEDAAGITSHYIYNNYLHDGNAALVIQVFYEAYIFNNVISNMTGNAAIYTNQCEPGLGTPPCGDNSSQVGWVANNTIDTSATTMSCYKWEGSAGLGTLNFYNNICIFGSGGVGGFSVATINGTATNYPMSTSEASTYGFTHANKYSPSSSDPNIAATGTNLTSSCVGNLAPLCQDASGTPWFGGAYKARPTGSAGWAKGAFQGQGGTTGPPTSSVTAPANGATISTNSVSLTATGTPQGTATITSIQLFVDNQSFGTHCTSSPCTVTLDSTKISNGSHTIYAVATDSNNQTGTASTITVTVNNSAPGCTTTNPLAVFQQGFTAQTATFPVDWDETPNSTGTNDTVVGFAPTAATTYGQMSALVRSNTSGFWDAYDGATNTYHAANSAPYTGGTVYHFHGTLTFTAGNLVNYSINETSPSAIVIATGWTPRAAATSLAYFVGISDAGLYDTAQVCNLQVGASPAPTLSYSPGNLNFGPVINTMTSMLTESTSVTNGPATITSAVVTGTGFSLDGSGTCPTSGSLSTSCTYIVDFTPPSTGSYSGTLTVTSNATGSPQVINLSGSGMSAAPTISPSPISLNFNGCQIGTTCAAGPIVVTINSPPVIFSSVGPSGGDAADFAVSAPANTCVGTFSGPTCQTTVTCTPSRPGVESTTLVYTSNASNNPQNVALSCTGAVSTSVAPSSALFVWQQTVQLPLTINGVALGKIAMPEICSCTVAAKPTICGCRPQ
jgi:hypothetical protein